MGRETGESRPILPSMAAQSGRFCIRQRPVLAQTKNPELRCNPVIFGRYEGMEAGHLALIGPYAQPVSGAAARPSGEITMPDQPPPASCRMPRSTLRAPRSCCVRPAIVFSAIAAAMGLGAAAGPASAQECDPVETAELLASDGGPSDWFGEAVAISGETVVIGVRAHDDNGTSSGSAYIFIRNGGMWTEQAELLLDGGVEGDRFGSSVSISGETVIIGTPGDNETGEDYGSASIFVRSGGVWSERAKLLAADGALHDGFGNAVALDGDTAIVGAPSDDDNGTSSGSAYIFVRSGGVWTQQAKLLPEDGVEEGRFGNAVSLRGDTAIIGMYQDDDNGLHSGSAYIFTRSGGSWTQQAKLLPDDGARTEYFGSSVSIHDDTAIIGTPRDGDNGSEYGSAYIFARNGDIWTQQAKLLPDDGAQYDRFGNSVSISGDTAVIGSHRHNGNDTSSGAAYIFARSGGIWTQQAKLLPEDGEAYDSFGEAVALSGDTAVIGAYSHGEAGSAYIFALGCETCPADLNNDGTVDTQDFVAFLGAWSGGDPLADWDENGILDTRDFVAYLGDWSAGCP